MTRTADELIDAMMRRDAGALREHLAQLRPWCTKKLFERFAFWGDQAADIVDEAESLLFEWSCSPRARELLPRGESLSTLAFRLLSRVIEKRRRDKGQHSRIAGEMAASVELLDTVTEPEAFATEGIAVVLASLPETHRKVLIAELHFQLGDGPPLGEALQSSSASARVRLSNARAAMWKALRLEDALESKENDDG